MEKQTTLNRFNQGINTDINNSDKQPTFMSDAQNCRLSKLGDGMYASTVKGNVEHFALNDGYIPMGSASYNGVLYIISYNPNTGLSEIGTFPSPRYTIPGYDAIYRPLQSFTLDNPSVLVGECIPYANVVLQDFRADLDMNCQYACKVLVREDYDGSVNIYWTDNINPIRVVNSGFVSATGLNNQRFTSALQIQSGSLNLLNESRFHPTIKLNRLEAGGNMKAGNYFFFVRYTDNNYNATSFLGQSKVVSVFNEKVVGAFSTTAYGGDSNTLTSQTVVLDISGLDSVATFIEVGFLYYFSDLEYSSNIIDYRYPINGQTSLQIKITGNETLLAAAIDDITGFKATDAQKAKDIAQLNNILYLANVSGPALDHKDLRLFCCAVELDEDANQKQLIAERMPSGDALYADNEQDVHQRIGYWSEETYVFSLVPVFVGGFVGRAFPCTGYDNITGTRVNPNKSGIFRFSNARVVPYYDGAFATIKGIKFDVSNALTIYGNSTWLQDNLLGFYVCRGERNKNVLCQGLAIKPTYIPQAFENDSRYEIKNFDDTKFLPAINTKIFGLNATLSGAVSPGSGPFNAGYANVGETKSGYRAVFSLDYMLEKDDYPLQTYTRVIGQAGLAEINSGSASRPFPNTDIAYYNQNVLTIDPTFISGFSSETVNVLGWTVAKNRNFVSKVTEGVATGSEGFIYGFKDRALPYLRDWLMNLPMAVPDYIGLIMNEADWGGNNTIVNVCKSDPSKIDYISQYDFKTTAFSAISDFIPIATFLSNNTVAYQGDCFIARDYIKTIHGFTDELGDEIKAVLSNPNYNNNWFGKGYSSTFTPADVLQKGWGVGLSLVVEHSYNPNYRHELGRNYFFPATGQLDYGKDFFWLLDSPESNFYNRGYIRTLSNRQHIGIDIFEPISNNRFPTRIRPSIPHVFGAIKDGYRVFRGGEYDFSYENGAINALAPFAEQLYSIQDNAINLHPVNERSQVQSSSGSSIALTQQIGLSGYKSTLIKGLGTQHRDSVVVSESAIYGFDFNRKVMWRVGGGGVENLNLSRFTQKWFLNATDVYTKLSNIMSNLPENHLCGLGIVAGFDAQYKEVNMTLHLSDTRRFTFCFSELIDAFQTRWSYTPIFYANIKDDFLTFALGRFWLHDANELHSHFYGQVSTFYIRFVANPSPETLKYFDDLVINSNNAILSYIKYETQHLKANQDPFLNPATFWLLPKYKRDAWHLAIRRSDTTIEPLLSPYSPAAPMTGMWLIIEIGYDSTKALNIRDVLTQYHLHQKS